MAVYFFDASAIAKRYFQEIGTTWVRGITNPISAHIVYLAGITVVEVSSAVARRQRGGTISASDATQIIGQYRTHLVREYRVIEITAKLLAQAASLAEAYALRAHDAVQLSAAMELRAHRIANHLSPITFVSSDKELNASATSVGLLVEDPNFYP